MDAILLDFDGVLNSHGYFMRINGTYEQFCKELSPEHFDIANIRYLEYFLEQCPSVQVIISSTWGRRHEVGEMRRFLLGAGMQRKYVDRILESTPRRFSSEKVDEISMWLRSYAEMEEPVDNWLVIDDYEQLGLDRLMQRHSGNSKFHLVNHTHGFTILDAIQCIQFFKPDWKVPQNFI